MGRQPIAIRTFEAADYDAVIMIWTDAGMRIGPSETRAGIELKLARDPELFLVAAEGDRVVGAVLGAFDGRRGWIYHLAVDREHRRAGVGRQLLEEAEDRLRARGCVKVNLHVRPENAGVVEFYETLGYAQDELIFMEKWLQNSTSGARRRS